MPITTKRITAACESPTLAAAWSWTLVAVALVAAGGSMRRAGAAELIVNDLGITQLAQARPSISPISPSSQSGPQQVTPPVAGGGVSTYTIPPPLPQAQNPYALADQLKLRGWVLPLPGAADTLDQGLFGARNALADAGISYLGLSNTTFQDNVLRHGLPLGNRFSAHSRDLQQYNGQLPTYTSVNNLYAMYDLRRYGIPDGQIVLGGVLATTNWNPAGPDAFSLAAATYYQTLFNRRVEVKVGYISNTTEFLGTQVGGSLASGVFGVSASIGVENGQNNSVFATPGMNVKVNLPADTYTKLGVQRGISPDGAVVEKYQNGSGLRFTVPNSGVFVIDETGYRVAAAPGQMQTWIRAAASYTSSRYNDLSSRVPGDRHNPNFGLYLLADRQLIQIAPNAGPGSAIRGVYAGFSAEYGPSYFNRFTQYYEARLYGFGLIPGRPFDLTSLVANRNVFSEDAVRLARGRRLLAHDATDTLTVSYSAHVLPGVNLNFGLSYIDHPTSITYDQHTGSALNVLANVFTFF